MAAASFAKKGREISASRGALIAGSHNRVRTALNYSPSPPPNKLGSSVSAQKFRHQNTKPREQRPTLVFQSKLQEMQSTKDLFEEKFNKMKEMLDSQIKKQ